ncbi:YkgJ family cysteine cluster protein [Accumulibacter sp.]|uniref:YkgJ family cysteine cluster protein n=1 Tax=Accumulibacter sp. TaxID=2053492 RepID=UPI002604E811|nr:YkgJ family cysteine cluster protein [Accumulibacter sp.]
MPSRRDCRPACGACCIAPSIGTPIPGHPRGKAADEPCVNLGADYLCRLWGRPERPAFCGGLQPSVEMCGDNRQHALDWLSALERATRP